MTKPVQGSLFPEAAPAIEAAAQGVISAAAQAIAARGVFHLGLSGGSTPLALFHRLAQSPQSVNWAAVQLWWADERCVPPDHADSNYAAAYSALLQYVAPQAVHRILGERGRVDGANLYEEALRQGLPSGEMDLLLLGMGDDGHTASLFPGAPALDEMQRWAIAVLHRAPPKPLLDRVSLTLPIINRSRHALFLVGGQAKRAVLEEVLRHPGPRSPYPAGRVQAPRVTWLVYDMPGLKILANDPGEQSLPQV